MNYKMILQYDGTRYNGWQKQGNTDNTIQGKLETLLSRIAGEPVEIHGAGRTDAGVHAAGQVANAKFHTDLSDEELLQTINHYLPEDIEVTSLARMPERFHSRLNAVDKTYEYRIVIDGRKHVFERKYVYFPEAPLDVEKMKEASKAFIGTYDFRSFCANKRMKNRQYGRLPELISARKTGFLSFLYRNRFSVPHGADPDRNACGGRDGKTGYRINDGASQSKKSRKCGFSCTGMRTPVKRSPI